MSRTTRIPLKDKGLGDKLSKNDPFFRKIVGQKVLLWEISLGNGLSFTFWRIGLCESVRFFSNFLLQISNISN